MNEKQYNEHVEKTALLLQSDLKAIGWNDDIYSQIIDDANYEKYQSLRSKYYANKKNPWEIL